MLLFSELYTSKWKKFLNYISNLIFYSYFQEYEYIIAFSSIFLCSCYAVSSVLLFFLEGNHFFFLAYFNNFFLCICNFLQLYSEICDLPLICLAWEFRGLFNLSSQLSLIFENSHVFSLQAFFSPLYYIFSLPGTIIHMLDIFTYPLLFFYS